MRSFCQGETTLRLLKWLSAGEREPICQWIGAQLLNQRFLPSVLAGEEGIEGVKNLIRSYFKLGGHHIQFNIIDKETLLDAQKHPENYKDLIVRVAGFSEKWCNLGTELQNEIINRTEQSF